MMVPVSDAAVKTIADAIFNGCPSTVAEAYSGFDQELVSFRTASELCAYADAQRASSGGAVFIAVCYPDMEGRLECTPVALDRQKCDGHSYRSRSDGWGLIWVYLQLHSSDVASFVSANSEKRAQAWAHIAPALDAPSTWDWPAVGRHLRRLRRPFKLEA